MNDTHSVSIRVFFIPYVFPGLWIFAFISPRWIVKQPQLALILFQLLTLCTVALHAAWPSHREEAVQSMASDKTQVVALTEHYSFLSVKFRGSSLHCSHWAAQRNCRAWGDILKIKILCSILPCWEGHVNPSQGDLLG